MKPGLPASTGLANMRAMRQTLRHWTETVETFILQVMLEQRRGKCVAVVRFILSLLSNVFAVAAKVRRFLSRR